MPTITASSNTPTIIGWSNASGTHSATYTSGQTGVTLTSGTTWYAQTQKTSVQGKVTFNPNGNTAFTYGGTKYTSTTTINLCTIGATYNGTAQGSTCTASVTMPTITASSNTPTIIGWSNASGTHSATYTSGQTGVTLTSGTTWYAQTQKTAVTLSANFNANGATLSSTASQSCILGAVYNGSSQTTSCTVTLPNATKSGYKFLGWYSDSNYNIKIGNAGDTYTISSNVSLYGRLGKISTVTLRTINNLMSSSDYTSSNKISLTGSNSDTYQYYDNIVVYLEAGREYYAYGESDGTWSTAHPTGGNSTAVGFWVYNADHAAHYLVPVNTGSFKVDYTGMYKLRLNVYQNGVTHQFWNFGVRPVDTTIQVVEGEKYSSLPSSVSLPGYDFTGWYTGSVTGDKVTNDTDVTIASDHTLYARWNGKSVKVTYDANDNMFSTTTRTVGSLSITYEEKYDGNYLTLNGTYTDSTSLMDYLIVFPEGKNVITTLTYVSGSYVEGSPSRWVSEIVDSNGSNLSTRNNADVVMPTESSPTSIESFTTSSLAASSGRYLRVWLWSYTSGTWVFNNYKIKVDIRVSDTLTTTLEQKTGDNYSLPTSNPTRIGYDFDGWYSDANGGAAITSSSVISVPVDHKVYAHWKKKNNITVNFTKQYFSSNDSLSADSVTVPYGTTYYLSNNKLVFSNGQTVSVNYPGVSSGSCTLKSIDWGSSSGMVTSSQSISVAINATCSLEKVNVSLSKSSVRYGETLGTITVSSTLSSSSTSYVSEISIFDSNRRYYRCSSSKCTKRVWSSSSTTANLPFRGTKVTFSDPIYSLITFKSVKKTLSGYNSNANGWGIVQNKSLTYHLANNNEASAMGLISGKVCYVSTNSSTNSSYCVSYTSGVTRTLKYNNNVGTVYFGNPTAGSDSLSAWTYTLSNDISKFSSSYSLLYAYALYNGNLSRSDYATLYDFGTLGS